MLQFIGLGACGSKIVREIEKLAPGYNIKPSVLYMNFDEVDMKDLHEVPGRQKLLLEGKGTGRHPAKGEELAKKNKKKITEFLRAKLKKDDMVILFFGAGGGTGSGLAPTVVDVLNKLKYPVGAAMTFPDSKSDVVVNQNAIYTLNHIMEKSNLIKPLVFIDNDYLIDSLKHDSKDWWKKVNKYIAGAFLNIQTLFDVGNDRASAAKGISNLDQGELKRTFYVDGLTDIKLINIPQQQLFRENFISRFKESLEKESLSGRYKLKDTLAYSCAIIVNDDFQSLDKCQEMFDAITELTPNSAIRRTGTIYRDSVQRLDVSSIQYVRVVLVAAGYKLPNEINKKIKQIKRDSQKFLKAKSKESKVNLNDGLESSIGVGDDFVI